MQVYLKIFVIVYAQNHFSDVSYGAKWEKLIFITLLWQWFAWDHLLIIAFGELSRVPGKAR